MLMVDNRNLTPISEVDQPGKFGRLLRFVWQC